MRQSEVYRRYQKAAISANKRARAAGVDGSIDASTLMSIASAYARCHYCGIGLEPMQGSFDHVIPMEKGGANRGYNIVRCCVTCNRRKFTKTPAEYSQARSLVVECEVCGTKFTPRWNDYKAGYGRTCSRRCSAVKSNVRA